MIKSPPLNEKFNVIFVELILASTIVSICRDAVGKLV